MVKFEQVPCANPRKSADVLDKNTRARILAHWNGQCAYCTATLAPAGGETHFDHVANGFHLGGCHHGTCNKSWNIAPSCARCNITKGSQSFGADGALTHSAVNVWFDRKCSGDIHTIARELTARFYGKLYTHVAGLESHFDSFPGVDAVKGALYMSNAGNQYTPVWEIIK